MTDEGSVPPDPTSGPGDLVADRYRLRHPLGGGAASTVWLAEDELLGRSVALKEALRSVLGWSEHPVGEDHGSGSRPETQHSETQHPGAPHPDSRRRETLRRETLREGRLAARLRTPHAVAVHDVVLHRGDPWLVLEYLPSRTLAQVVRDQQVLAPRQAARVIAQVADALGQAHAAGIVHQDVKPANILVGDGGAEDGDSGGDVDGLVKITDFGIAHAFDSGDDGEDTGSDERGGLVAGTPSFLAPEVARGGRPSTASDVFSLGATLYACVEGHPPFGADRDPTVVLRRAAAGDVPAPVRAGALEPVLGRMLAADPADRPSMTTVRDELAEVAGGRDGTLTEVLDDRHPLHPVALAGAPAQAGGVGLATPAVVLIGTGLAAVVAVLVGIAARSPAPSALVPAGSASAPATTPAPAPATSTADARAAVTAFLDRLPSDAVGAFGEGGPVLRAVDPTVVAGYFRSVRAVRASSLGGSDGVVSAELVLTGTDGVETTRGLTFTVAGSDRGPVVDSGSLAALLISVPTTPPSTTRSSPADGGAPADGTSATPTTAAGASTTAAPAPTAGPAVTSRAPATSGPPSRSTTPPSDPVPPASTPSPSTATEPTPSTDPVVPTELPTLLPGSDG